MKYKIHFQKNNKINTVILDASSLEELSKLKIFPQNILHIEAIETPHFFSFVSINEYYQFFYEFHILLSSGIPIFEAIEILQENKYHKNIEQMLQKIYHGLHQGNSIFTTLEDEKNIPYIIKYFLYVAEETNNYEKSITSLLEIISIQRDIKKRFYKALFYPFILTISIIFAMLILVFYVLPEFEYIFIQSGNNLPKMTQLLLNLKVFISEYSFWIVLFFIVFVMYILVAFKKSNRYDRLLYEYMPFYKEYLVYQFFVGIRISISSKMQFIGSVEFSTYMIKNTYFKTKIQEVVLHIKNGIPLGEAFEMSHLLSNKTIRLFYISKYGDNLQLILENMVKMLEQDYITKIDKFSNSIGPILIFFLGGIVLFMVIAILSPIWDMGSVLG